MSEIVHQLRCTGCHLVLAERDGPSNFRCRECGDLFEVEYPAWSPVSGSSDANPTNGMSPISAASTAHRAWMPNASALRWLWKERRHSALPIDQSGVWRF